MSVLRHTHRSALGSLGNISAASIPCLMDEYNRKGLLKKGERYVLSGFGSGLTYATAVVVWNK